MSSGETVGKRRCSRFVVAIIAVLLGMALGFSAQAAPGVQTAFAAPVSQAAPNTQTAFATTEGASIETLQQGGIELQADMERTVWCSRSGSKYHYSSTCSGMKNPIAMTLRQAVDSGKQPCSKCVHESPTPDPAPNPSPDPTPTPTPDPQPQYRGFVDVPADSWYVESGVFDYALDHGLMKGYSDGSSRFGPDDSITRAMAVTVLWRMAGEPACEAPDFDDADYSEESWYKDAVRWARASEVVKGYEGTNYFGPNDPVTREQLAVMVARFASTISHIDTSSTGAALAAKPDAASVSDWARDAVAWSVDQGILGGASIIDPQGTATRCQGCKMLSIAHKIIGNQGASHGEARVHFIDVGQGDSEFIELPNGKTMLIDAGTTESGEKVASYIAGLGYSRIDYVIATHPHEDHIGGMARVLRSFDIGEIWMPRATSNTATFEGLLDVIAEKGILVHAAEEGKIICSDEGFSATILSPFETSYSDLNDWSVILELDVGVKSFLFTGDASSSVIGKACGHHVDVLKVGHHGSRTSTTQQLAETLSPDWAVISVGAGNSYGHPSEEVLSALSGVAHLLRTDLDGTVTLSCDGETIRRAA